MEELKQGFNNDLSKTFDDDETFNKVSHFCRYNGTLLRAMLPVGSTCQVCKQKVTKPGGTIHE